MSTRFSPSMVLFMQEIIRHKRFLAPHAQPLTIGRMRFLRRIKLPDRQSRRKEYVFVPRAHDALAFFNPRIQTDILFRSVIVLSEGSLTDIERCMIVFFKERQHAAAMVVMPVAQYGHIHIVKTYPQCLGIP